MTTSDTSASRSRNSDTHRQMHELFNRGDFDSMRANFADDVTFEDVPRGITASSPDEVIDWLQTWRTGFSDATVGNPEYLDGGDHSVAFFQAQGTNDGEFGPASKTGQRLDTPFCEVAQFNDEGKLTSAKLYYDQATILQQLGILQDIPQAQSSQR